MAEFITKTRAVPADTEKFSGWIFDVTQPKADWPVGVVEVGMSTLGQRLFAYVNSAAGTVEQIKPGQAVTTQRVRSIPKGSGWVANPKEPSIGPNKPITEIHLEAGTPPSQNSFPRPSK